MGSLTWAVVLCLVAPGCPPAESGAPARAAAADAQGAAAAASPGFEAARQRAVALSESGAAPHVVVAALEEASALDPSHYDTNLLLARRCQELKLHERALAAYARAHAARPDERATQLSMAALEVRLGLAEAAQEHLEPLLGDARLGGEAHYQLALLLEQEGRGEEALAVAARAEALPPAQSWRCLAMLGRARLEAGDFAGARERFRRALEGRPDSKEAHKGLADAARRAGDLAVAERHDRVLALLAELTDNVFMRAPEHAPRRRGILEALTAELPEWSDGFRELAECQLGLGDREAACATLRRWLATHGAALPASETKALRARYCGGGRR